MVSSTVSGSDSAETRLFETVGEPDLTALIVDQKLVPLHRAVPSLQIVSRDFAALHHKLDSLKFRDVL
jgi:hypothetical protein